MAKHIIDELRQKQSLPLKAKITLTKQRLREWHDYWDGNVYVSFSGGKDSTVLLHIARQLYPKIPAVFCDTGLEFPEIRQHVKTFDNVEIIRPEKNFRQVIAQYGWVFPSKDIAMTIYYAKQGSTWAKKRMSGQDKDGTPSSFKKERYQRWNDFAANAPFSISHKCCIEMKEKPLDKYQSRQGLKPIIATLADESFRRTQSWLRTGCNSYNNRPSSQPLSFWTEQDVLRYIKEYGVKIPSVYGDIIESNDKLKCTGEDRTGCMFCLIGCHLEHGSRRRFVRMKKTHPQIYAYCIEQLGMKGILDYIHDFCKCKELLYGDDLQGSLF